MIAHTSAPFLSVAMAEKDGNSAGNGAAEADTATTDPYIVDADEFGPPEAVHSSLSWIEVSWSAAFI